MKKYITILAMLLILCSCEVPEEMEVSPIQSQVLVEAPKVKEVTIKSTASEVIEETPEEKPWMDDEANALARMLWGEARGIASDTEKAACVWVVLNRVDMNGGTIIGVVTAPNQFFGYSASNPVDEDLKELCEDVLGRWYAEKDGETDVGRVLPADYIYFTGYGGHNHFRAVYNGGGAWDWSLGSPYED